MLNLNIKNALLALACTLAVSAYAVGETQAKKIDVPAGQLTVALKELAAQSGVEFVYSTDQLAGMQTQGVHGEYTAEKAVMKLLEGTNLKLTLHDSGAILITAPETAADVPAAGDAIRVAQSEAGESPQSAENKKSDAALPEGAAEASNAKLEEIIVTATRRAERLQDVPLSITAVTAEDIDRRGLVNAADYLRGIPGVNQAEGGEGQAIVIRGIETSPYYQNQNTGGPTTATYFGETPTTTTVGFSGGSSIDLKLVDIERVEILRGPQGTSFGNSSLGGAVRTIPVAPKLDRVEGKVAAGYSATSGAGGDNNTVQFVGNLPLVRDKLAIRAVGYRYQDSGFYRNRAGSDAAFRAATATFGASSFAVDEDEIGTSNVRGGRVAVLFQATDDLSLTLNYLKQKSETDGFGAANSGTFDQTLLQVAPEHVVRGDRAGVLDTDVEIANAVVQYDFGWANLLATYSDTDSGSINALTFGGFGAPAGTEVLPASYYAPSEHREHVGEIRLATQLSGAWDFLVGAYAEEVKDEVLFSYRWFGDPATNLFNPGDTLIGDQQGSSVLKQKAAFGEASWELLPGLKLTGGVRAYDYERTTRTSYPTGFFFAPAAPDSTTTFDASGTNFRANLSYKLHEDALLYAGWAQGFRLGRPQAPVCGNQRADIDSDEMDSVELGGKFALLDRRVTVEGAVFRMDWTNIPVRSLIDCGAIDLVYIANAGTALSEGAEFQAKFQVTERLRTDLGGSWIRARLTKDVPQEGFSSGDRLPGSPKFNANVGLQYEFQIKGYQAFMRADSIYVGPYYGNLLQTPNTKSGDYMKVDATARVTLHNLDLDLFVRNLTNQDDFTFRGIAKDTPDPFGYRLRPRTVGMQLTYRFGR